MNLSRPTPKSDEFEEFQKNFSGKPSVKVFKKKTEEKQPVQENTTIPFISNIVERKVDKLMKPPSIQKGSFPEVEHRSKVCFFLFIFLEIFWKKNEGIVE
jgi:hypothetical protein